MSEQIFTRQASFLLVFGILHCTVFTMQSTLNFSLHALLNIQHISRAAQGREEALGDLRKRCHSSCCMVLVRLRGMFLSLMGWEKWYLTDVHRSAIPAQGSHTRLGQILPFKCSFVKVLPMKSLSNLLGCDTKKHLLASPQNPCSVVAVIMHFCLH